MTSPFITIVNEKNFEAEVLKSDKLVLIDFYAEWCPPCKALAPTLEKFAEDNQDKVKVVKVNVDDNPQAPTQYGVRSIPTLLIFKGGSVVAQQVGSMGKSDLFKWVDGSI